MPNSSYPQYPLALHLDSAATFENYYAVEQAAWLPALRTLVSSVSGDWIYLWGAEGSGVSHLLQATCGAAAAAGKVSICLDLAEVAAHPPAAVFEDVDRIDVLCLDNIEAVLGRTDWEEQLFYLLQRLRDKPNSRLLIGAHAPVRGLSVALADLQSRLAWSTVFQLAVLTDDDKRQILTLRARHMGLTLREEVAQFLLNRCSRDLRELLAVLHQLDTLAMASQRRLTIPWIKAVMPL